MANLIAIAYSAGNIPQKKLREFCRLNPLGPSEFLKISALSEQD
jgi:hypothetical protein